MSERLSCGACGGWQLNTFLDLGKTPLANTFPATDTEPETWYPLGLCRCNNCGLVQNTEVIPDDLIFGEDYGFYSGGSTAQLDYHRAGAKLLLDQHSAKAEQLTVEIACNDGSLLQHFVAQECNVLGIDPAAPTDVALAAGLPVIKKTFTANLAREIRAEHGPAGLVIAYNSMAHVDDLSDVLTGIWELLAQDNGVAVVEVQYLADMLTGNLFDQVYHEHRYFYSLTSFKHVAELHGLNVIDAELIELQAGGLRVTLSASRSLPSDRARRILESERWLSQPEVYGSVQGRVDRVRDHLLDIISALNAQGDRIAGYTASAKATTILNYCGLGPDLVPYVIDQTPHKHGRYVPGTRIPIIAAGRATYPPKRSGHRTSWVLRSNVRLLLSSNYLGHVLRNEREFIEFGGKWLVPLPSPVVI